MNTTSYLRSLNEREQITEHSSEKEIRNIIAMARSHSEYLEASKYYNKIAIQKRMAKKRTDEIRSNYRSAVASKFSSF